MDGIGFYLNAAGKIPLLTAEEEIILGRTVQAMQALLASNPEGPYTKEESRTLRAGKRAKERMVNGNLRLVVSVAKRFMYRTQSLELSDLVQEGTIGLIRGVEKFDPERGFKASTYLYWWIRQGMSRAVAQSDRMVRLPGAAGDILAKIRRYVADYQNDNGSKPSLEQCAAFANIHPDTLTFYLSHAAGHASLDAPASSHRDNEGSSIIEMLASSSINNVDTAWECMEIDRAQALLDHLTDAERDLVDQVFGLTTGQPKTLYEIGRERGTSRENIRQTKERALRKLRILTAKTPLLL